MAKVSQLERVIWPFEDEADGICDAKATQLYTELGLSEDEAFVYALSLLTTFDDGNIYQIGSAYLDGDRLSWRNGDAVF